MSGHALEVGGPCLIEWCMPLDHQSRSWKSDQSATRVLDKTVGAKPYKPNKACRHLTSTWISQFCHCVQCRTGQLVASYQSTCSLPNAIISPRHLPHLHLMLAVGTKAQTRCARLVLTARHRSQAHNNTTFGSTETFAADHTSRMRNPNWSAGLK